MQTLKLRQEIGISSIIFGVYLAKVLSEFIGRNINFQVYFLLAGVLLIFDYRKLYKIRFSIAELVYMLFQLILIVSIMLSKASIGKNVSGNGNNTTDFTYCLFAIGLIFAMSTVKGKVINKLPVINFSISVFIMFAMTLIIGSSKGFAFSNRFVFSTGGDAITMALGTSICYIGLLIYNPKAKIGLIFKVSAAIAGVYCLLAYGTRTADISALIITLTYFLQSAKIDKRMSEGIVKVAGVVVLFVFSFAWLGNIVPKVKNAMDTIGLHTIKGVYTLFGNSVYGQDASALARVNSRNEVLSVLYKHTDILKILFGHGYLTMYLDFPLLQIFIDLGLFGIFYVFIIVIWPLKIFFNNKLHCLAKNSEKFRAQYLTFTLLAIQVIVKQFVSGLPYGGDVYWPSIMCMFLAGSFINKVIDPNTVHDMHHIGERKVSLMRFRQSKNKYSARVIK